MIGLIEPLAGQILFDGEDIVRAEGEDRLRLLRRFGVMYQSGALFGSMTRSRERAPAAGRVLGPRRLREKDLVAHGEAQPGGPAARPRAGCPRSSPAACRSGPGSPARWRSTRGSSFSTSRRRAGPEHLGRPRPDDPRALARARHHVRRRDPRAPEHLRHRRPLHHARRRGGDTDRRGPSGGSPGPFGESDVRQFFLRQAVPGAGAEKRGAMSEKPNQFRIGLFVLVGVGIVLGALFLFGIRSAFQDVQRFETYVTGNVDGLSKGSAVKLRGVAVGKVTEIGFSWKIYENVSPRCVVVRFDVENGSVRVAGGRDRSRAAEVIDQGLRAVVQGEGITGSSIVAIQNVDPEKYPPLKVPWKPEYHYIPSAPSQFGQILASVDRRSPEPREARRGEDLGERQPNAGLGERGAAEARAPRPLGRSRATSIADDASSAVLEIRGLAEDARKTLQACSSRRWAKSGPASERSGLPARDPDREAQRHRRAGLERDVRRHARGRPQPERRARGAQEASVGLPLRGRPRRSSGL